MTDDIVRGVDPRHSPVIPRGAKRSRGIHPDHQTPCPQQRRRRGPIPAQGNALGLRHMQKMSQALKGRTIHPQRTRFGRVGSPFQGWFRSTAMVPRALPWAFVVRPVGAAPILTTRHRPTASASARTSLANATPRHSARSEAESRNPPRPPRHRQSVRTRPPGGCRVDRRGGCT
jgi:hypothetical protein